MPNTKSEGPSKATGRALSFALMLTLMAKGYPEMPVATLVNLLHITPDDANAIADGVLPSPEAVEKYAASFLTTPQKTPKNRLSNTKSSHGRL